MVDSTMAVLTRGASRNLVESTTINFWMTQVCYHLQLIFGCNKPNISAMIDLAMAVLTRGASRNLVDSIAVNLQLKQVEFICCSLTIETKELEC